MSLPNANSSNSNNNHTASPLYNTNNNNSNKSVIKKSSKNDLMRAAVGLLLKQKNYVVSGEYIYTNIYTKTSMLLLTGQ